MGGSAVGSRQWVMVVVVVQWWCGVCAVVHQGAGGKVQGEGRGARAVWVPNVSLVFGLMTDHTAAAACRL